MSGAPRPPSRIPYGARLALALAAECAYLAARTAVFSQYPDLMEREVALSLLRLASALACIALFPEILRGDAARRAPPLHPLLVAVVAIDLLAMPLAGLSMAFNPPASLVLAATAPIVGLREEIFYRGILQEALVKRLGPFAGIALASVAFVLFHTGAQAMNANTIVSFAAAGVLLGVIYHRTRNIWLVVALHTLYDILAVMLPRMAILAPWMAILAHAIVILGAALWARMDAGKPEGP